MAIFAPIGIAVAAVLTVYFGAVPRQFAIDACWRLDRALSENVVGQPLATQLITETICGHLKEKQPLKPLVLSVHGSPGVGKTFSHQLAAQALYGLGGGQDTMGVYLMRTIHHVKRSSQRYLPLVREFGAFYEKLFGNPLNCPGAGCPAYKILYGTDFISYERADQHQMMRDSIVTHAKNYPESLIVIEEYDKMACETRAMIRQIIQHPEAANISLSKSVIILEANKGMFPIQRLLLKAGRREDVSVYKAHHKLKEDMADLWMNVDCEASVDAVKFLNLIDIFIPFFPLERSHIRELIQKSLDLSKEFAPKGGSVTWTPSFVEYFVDQVEYDGVFSVDGAVDAALGIRKAYELLRTAEKNPTVQQCRREDLSFVLTVDHGNPDLWIFCQGKT